MNYKKCNKCGLYSIKKNEEEIENKDICVVSVNMCLKTNQERNCIRSYGKNM
jgi:hypothetical protein